MTVVRVRIWRPMKLKDTCWLAYWSYSNVCILLNINTRKCNLCHGKHTVIGLMYVCIWYTCITFYEQELPLPHKKKSKNISWKKKLHIGKTKYFLLQLLNWLCELASLFHYYGVSTCLHDYITYIYIHVSWTQRNISE